MKNYIETIVFFPERFWRKITGNSYWRISFQEEKRRADSLESIVQHLEELMNMEKNK